MNEFTVTLLILVLPGIISLFLCNKLIGRLNRSFIETVFTVFLYSILSYLLLDLFTFLLNLFPCIQINLSALKMIFSVREKPVIDLNVLLWASFASIVMAFIISYVIRFNLINRFGQLINATKRYGDEDVWHYFHNAPDSEKNDGWVVVRDLKEELAYHCYISTWSDTGMDRELVLSDVSVFDNNSVFLYKIQHLYISRNKDDIDIEIPPLDLVLQKEWKLKEKENSNDK